MVQFEEAEAVEKALAMDGKSMVSREVDQWQTVQEAVLCGTVRCRSQSWWFEN